MHGFLVHILLLGNLIFHSPREYQDLSLELSVLADSKAEIVEMPKATAYLVSGKDGTYLEDRFDVFDLWRSDAIRACWRDSDGNRFSICRISRKLPGDAAVETRTRLDYSMRYSASVLGAKDFDALDEAVFLLSPVEVMGRVKPRRSQRRNLAELWQYPTTNENAFVYAFRPRVERKHVADWYLVSLVSDDLEAAEKMDAWLDGVRWLEPDVNFGDARKIGRNSPVETELLASDYRRSVINHHNWHFSSASNVVIVDNMPDCVRGRFVADLTNGLSRIQAEYRKLLPSPLSDDSHIAAVRIFGSREEYLAYVGADMKWSVALWSPMHRELVLYWPEGGSETLLRTVWHEALHQHLDYACAMIQSPAWFNEGHAVLFEHSHFNLDGDIVFDPVPDAVAAIKPNLSEIAECLPSVFEMDYPDFYSGSGEERIMKYHIAWSVAYFLQLGAPDVRFQPFKNIRADMMKALVRTRNRNEAVKTVLTDEMQRELVAEWLSFWKMY